MEQLKMMKEQLTSIVQGQLAHSDCVDTKELGEAVDMIKDLAEACYYCAITKAMEEEEKPKKEAYYSRPYEDYNNGKMYYGGQGGNSGNQGGNSMMYTTPQRMNPVYYGQDMYREKDWNMGQHDYREGRAMNSRRMYMESKEMHKDSATQMKELERYIKDLGEDITEMIANASPEEKEVLQQKIAMLSNKIQ